MVRLFSARTTTGDSSPISGDSAVVNTGVLSVRVVSGAPTFTLKVKARVLGRGHKDSLASAAANFDHYLAIANRQSGATVDGATGITAAGLYTVDLSGIEAVAELSAIAGGGITVDFVPLRG